MKDRILSEIISAPNQIIGQLPLTFEEYAFLLFPGKLYGDRYVYDRAKHKSVMNKLATEISDKGAQFVHKAGMAYALKITSKRDLFIEPKKHIDALKYSYEMICTQPVELYTKAIGFGFTGMVFKYERNKVVKIAYNNIKENEYILWNYQKENRRTCFPEIHYVDKDIVIMEEVKTTSDKLMRFKSYIDKYVSLNFMEEISYRTLNSPIESLPCEFQQFINEIQTSLYKVFNIKCIGDIKIENIGQRFSTGEIVMFDPIGGTIDYNKRISMFKSSSGVKK